MGGRPLGCNYPYECADGEWTGPLWGSDSDQGDDCVREWRQTHRQMVVVWQKRETGCLYPWHAPQKNRQPVAGPRSEAVS